MFLSNPRTSLWTLCAFVVTAAACGSPQTEGNTVFTGTLETRQRFPFPVKEPDVYQASISFTSADGDAHFFVAKKDGRWRYDVYAEGKPEFTYLKNDKVYTIDHAAKTFREEQKGTDPLIPTLSGEGVAGMFEGRDHPRFETVGTEGNVTKYRAFSDGTPGDIFIYFDASVGLITREEFPEIDGRPARLYELRDIRTEVEDNVFAIPAGYKKVGDK